MDKIDSMMNKMIEALIKNPESAPKRVLVVSMSKKSLEKILTPARMEIIRTISGKKPSSVGELVKMVKRPKESVSRDLRTLENYGLLSFAQVGRVKTPRIDKDFLMIPLTA
jgi:predicted transcriptional regulator